MMAGLFFPRLSLRVDNLAPASGVDWGTAAFEGESFLPHG